MGPHQPTSVEIPTKPSTKWPEGHTGHSCLRCKVPMRTRHAEFIELCEPCGAIAAECVHGVPRTVATVAGPRAIPRGTIPHATADRFPLTAILSKTMGDRWTTSATFSNLADAAIDAICHHLRAPLAKLDPRLVDAIEDHLSYEPKEGDADAEAECSIEDIEARRGRSYARTDVLASTNGKRYTQEELAAMTGAMLKRPSETDRYEAMRSLGHSPAEALAIVLQERRTGDGRNAWNGGAL